MTDYVLEYCNDILSGKINACKKQIKMCEREINDRKRSENDNFPYYFDLKEANKSIKFISLIPKTDGTKLEMAGFQKFIVGCLSGWRRKDNHYRRFKDAYISMARKSGKTYIASALAIQALLLEKVPAKNRQVLFISNALKQAKLGYNMMSSEIRQLQRESPFLRRAIDVKKKQITKLDDDSFAIAVAGKPETLDGFSSSGMALIDEYWMQKDDSVLNSIKSGQIKEPNSLCAICSTTGKFQHGAMKKLYDHYTDVLNGKHEEDTTFIAIWELDNPEEVTDSDNWIKANPLLINKEVSDVLKPKLQADLDSALQTKDTSNFIIKNMNCWLNASDDSFISDSDWQNAIVKPKPDISGSKAYIGLDLSATNDLTSISWLCQLNSGKWFADSYSFVSTKTDIVTKMKADGINYEALEKSSECELSKLDSGLVDYDLVYQFIIDLIKKNNLDIQEVCYDPWQGSAIISRLEKHGDIPLFEVTQNEKMLSEPTKAFREAIINKNIVVADNHLLRYAVQNAVLHYNSTGAIRVDKLRNNQKIDPIAAMIDAYTLLHLKEIEVSNEKPNEYYENFSF